MAESTLETSLQPDGIHGRLNALVGRWEGTTCTWFMPDQLADESPVRGTIRSLLGGRFVLHEYEGSLQGDSFEGVAVYGHRLLDGTDQMAWIDSFHTGTDLMFSHGRATDNVLSVLGHYLDPEGGPPWGWRTEITIRDTDHITITHYNVTPGGDEAKAVETVYTRTPGPDSDGSA